jgi:hypothetical protein
MRFALAALVAVHGLLHLIGVVQHWKLAELPQLTGRTLFNLPQTWERGLGAAWLVACLGMLASAGALSLRSQHFAALALGSVALSQLLIVHAFPDAKFGTLVNLLLLLAATVAVAQSRFERETERLVDEMLSPAPASAAAPITAADLERLPPPVRQWLERAGVVGKPPVRSLRLTQRGQMRTAADGAWMPARASQWFRTDAPGFVWQADIRMKGLPLHGRDSYLAGQGRMRILLGALVPIVDASNAHIQQGTLLRFLGELIWFPSAALAPYIRWEARDAHSAVAHMAYAGAQGSATWHFDADGRFVSLSALRYMGSGAEARLEDWVCTASEYRRFDGIEVPVAGEVSWKLKTGDLTYYRWHIDDIEYQ